MPVDFPTTVFNPQGELAQAASIGMTPLNALFSGMQQRDMQEMRQKALRDAEEMIRQRHLENIGRQRDAFKAQLEMTTPDFMEQKLRGESGTSTTQELAGARAKLLLPFMNAAGSPDLTPEQLAELKKRGVGIAGIIADTDPSNIAKQEQLQLKQKIAQVKQADVQKLMNWAASTGTPLSTAIDIYLQGNQYLSDKSGVPTTTTAQGGSPTLPSVGQPNASISKTGAGNNFPSIDPDQQYQRDKDSLLIKQQELAKNPNDVTLQQDIANTQRKIAEYEARQSGVGSAQPQPKPQSTDNLLGRVIERKTNSSREARYSDNVAIAANEARTAVQNIASMPFKTTSGIFGATREEKNIMSAPVNALKNKLSKESTTSYNAEVDNIGSFYARLINGGLSPSQSEINKFTNQFRIREGEDGLTALTRLAQMRQAFERAAEVKLNSKATPPEQLDMWRNAVADVKEAIPLTVADVNKFRDLKNPNKSFTQFMQETKQTVDNSTQTVTVGGKTYNRPAGMSDVQWSNYKKAMGVQ